MAPPPAIAAVSAAQVVAAATAAKRLTAKQLQRKFSLVDRLLIRETRIKNTIEEYGIDTFMQKSRMKNPQPFQPTRNPHTNRTIPPRISLRRQADIGKAAYRDGRFDELIESLSNLNIGLGPKLHKMNVRVQQLRKQEAGAAKAAAAAAAGGAPSQPVAASAAAATEGVSVEVSVSRPRVARISRAKSNFLAKEHAKQIAATHGPYRGRKAKLIFKGHKAERDAPRRKAEIKAKMKDMKRIVQNYRWAAKKRSYPRGAYKPV